MTRPIFHLFTLTVLAGAVIMPIARAQEALRVPLEATYGRWQDAMVRKDIFTWQAVTATFRQMEIRNRLASERIAFPGGVFELPAPPPALKGLTFLEAKQKGATAKASYFGKIDFGLEESKPTENLLVASFVQENGVWKYDRADYINLAALPAVRGELAAGNLNYLKETPDAQPNGVVPPVPLQAPTAKYIAKVYVFCPGREVQVQINKISHHKFANAKEAEVVIGGAVDGQNEIQFAIRKLDGGTGKEAMTIRVYLKPEVRGVDPVKIFEYQIQPDGVPKTADTQRFFVTPQVAAKLQGK